MTRNEQTQRLVAALALLVLLPNFAYAYIDPGTTSALFALLAPAFAIAGVFLGYLLWPFRYVIKRWFGAKGEEPEAEPEAAEAESQEPVETP